MSPAKYIEAIIAAADALEPLAYSTVSFCEEPIEAVEAVAAHFGKPLTVHFYEKDSTVIVTAAFQLQNTWVNCAAARRAATEEEARANTVAESRGAA